MSGSNILLAIVAALLGLVALSCGIGAISAAIQGKMKLFHNFGGSCLAALAIASASGVAASGILSSSTVNNGTNGLIPMSETQEPSDDAGASAVIDLAGGEADPIEMVSMTQKQINTFMTEGGYTRDYCDCTTYSQFDARVQAIRKVTGDGKAYNDAVAFPIDDETLKLVEQLVKTTDQEQRDELDKQIKHTLFQHIISDPAYRQMWMDTVIDCELLVANNEWVILEANEHRSIFNGSFVALDKTSEDYGVRSKLELAYIPVPSDPKLVGLEWMLEGSSTSASGYQVCQPCVNVAVKLCCVIDHLDIVGFTTSKSKVNYCNTSGVDALTMMAPATYQESRKSVLLSLPGKHGQSALDLGWNTEDQRAIKYGQPAAPAPVSSSTPAPDPTPTPETSWTPEPSPTPSWTPPPSEAPKLYNALIEYVRVEDGMEVATPHKNSNLQNGTSYPVVSPTVRGYVPDLANVQVEIRNGNFYKKVIYYPVDCPVNVLHWYVGTTTHVEGTTDVHTTVKYNARFEYTPPAVPGYTHTPLFISEVITSTDGKTFIVYYGQDGKGMKDSSQDPVNNSNAPEGGYPNESDAGTGDAQESANIHDYGTQSSNPPDISQEPTTTHDPTKPVTGPGTVIQGDVPATAPIEVVDNSNAKDDTTGQDFNPAAENNNNVVVGGDDF